jgi:ribosomal-protein-alanine N-acetyltransferase
LGQVWRFAETTDASAEQIFGWHYEEPYAFYDLPADPEDADEFADRARWRMRDLESDREVLLAVHDDDGRLVGFFAFRDSPDLCTIGFGLAPELTGQGLGASFVRAGLAFGRETWGVTRYRLEVATFNQRAITVYERLGFVRTRDFTRETNHTVVEFIEMTRPSEDKRN